MTSAGVVAGLSDEDLLAGLARLVAASNCVTAELLAHIGEVDARKLYREQACSSMFEYCVRRLRLSEGAAYRRIHVARAARRFPAVLARVADGRVHLSGLSLLAPHLTEDNCERLLARAEHRSKREIEELVAELAPKPAVRSTIRAVPKRLPGPSRSSASAAAYPQPMAAAAASLSVGAPRPAGAPPATPAPTPKPAHLAAAVEPLSAQAFKVQFTADRALRDKLETAKELMRHRVPTGDLAPIVDRALDLLIDELLNERFGVTSGPRASTPPKPGSRHVPRAVRRAVLARDGRQCAFVDEQGRRCRQRSFLELDHIVPFAKGGEATVENTRLLCRCHNQLHAEREFGRAHVERRVHEQQALW